MAKENIGRITQIIGAVLDIKFTEGYLPQINEAVHITRKNGERLVVEVAQHLGRRYGAVYCPGQHGRTDSGNGSGSDKRADCGTGGRTDAGTYF